jgi:hypothetical protein
MAHFPLNFKLKSSRHMNLSYFQACYMCSESYLSRLDHLNNISRKAEIMKLKYCTISLFGPTNYAHRPCYFITVCFIKSQWLCRLKNMEGRRTIFFWATTFLRSFNSLDFPAVIFFTEQIRHLYVRPPTWRTSSLYLCLPVTGWLSYTPRHRVPFPSPSTTLIATVEVF